METPLNNKSSLPQRPALSAWLSYPTRALTLAFGTFAASVLSAQEAETTESESESAVTPAAASEIQLQELETLVATGFLASLRASQEEQRASLNISNVISADDFGQLPDDNIAEALRRLPGVTVESSSGGAEARYVSIRGMNADFNAISINGVRVSVSNFDGASRAVPLDVIPTASAESIVVSKAITPDQDGDGIGGSINIRTRSIFDTYQNFASIEGVVGYSRMAERYTGNYPYSNPNYSFRANGGFFLNEEETLGFAFSANYRDRAFTDQSIASTGWRLVQNPNEGLYAPNGIVFQNYFSQIEEVGGTASFDFRPDEDTSLRLDVSYSERESNNGRQRMNYNFGFSDNFNDFFGPREDNGENYTRFEKDFTRVEREIRDFNDTQSNLGIALNGKKELDNGAFSWLAGYNRGSFKGNPDRDMQVRFRTARTDTLFENQGNPRFPNVESTFIDEYDPDEFFFDRANLVTSSITDTEYVLGADYRFDFELGDHPAFIQIGAKGRFRERQRDQRELFYFDADADWTPNGVFDLGGNQLYGSIIADYAPKNFLRGRYNDQFGFFLDPNATREALRILEANGLLITDPIDDEARSAVNSARIDEDVYATYVMGQTSINRLTVLAGVRLEHTRTTYRTADGELDGAFFIGFEPITARNSYTNVLPGIHLRYDATDDIVLRASWNNTIARPTYRELNPSTQFDFFDEEVRFGSPDLDPVKSMNFDLGIEYYFKRTGLLSAGVFYKRQKNNIYLLRGQVPMDGSAFEGFDFTQFQNARGADLYGIELSADIPFDFEFVPDFLQDFGLYSNFTYIDSKVDTGLPGRSRSSTPLFGQVGKSYNVGIYYDTRRFEARVGYTWRDSYLAFNGLSEDPNLDRYLDTLGLLDFSATYHFNRNFNIFMQAQNVLNSPTRAFEGNRSRLDFYEYEDWSVFFGANWRL